MKKLRKLFALVAAMAIVLAMCTSAFANTPVDPSKHTFVAYQVFAGTLSEDGKLSDITWGTGVYGDSLLAALSSDPAYAACKTAEDVADVLARAATDSAAAKAFAKIADANKTEVKTPVQDGDTLASGYYLIVDTTDVEGKTDAKNLSLLQISKDVQIRSKSEYVTSEKKVKDKNDTDGTVTDWQDSADYDIGDVIPFQLKGTVASNYADYTTYKYVFHDVESEGLTFDPTSVKVYVGTTDITSAFVVNTTCTDGCTFEIGCANLKDISEVAAGSTIIVEYNATLNDKAKFGSTGNPNEMCLEFSNNANGEGTGKTQKDKVIVFTYKVVANKITTEKNPLEGAAFELFKEVSGEYVSLGVVGATKGEDGKYTVDPKKPTTFEWKGVDDGKYKIVEVVTPEGFNSIEPIEFEVKAEHDILADNPQLRSLIGGDLFKGDVSTGAVTGNIVNKSGSTLPETGGMGTTILYVIGGIFVVAATILLVTKKRMSNE